MEREDYEAIVKLMIEFPCTDTAPAVVEHAKRCRLDMKQCPTCRHMETLKNFPATAPAFMMHAESCALTTKECEICAAGDRDFRLGMFAKLAEARRYFKEPRPWREKLFAWYLDKRYAILQRIWIWRGCPGERPKYTL